MIGKKINQLATELSPVSTDLTIIGDPISGVSKKITLAQLGAIFSGAVSFYTDLASFPATGDINVIYCAKDTQKLYLWSGSAYTEVFPSQALLDTYQLRSEKGNANGYASLDSGGKVPISQLPSSIMEYKGTWNASTNTPTLANGTGDTGDVYICNVAGTVNFGAGPLTFAVGDYVIYSGTIWQRSSGAVGTVTSVALTVGGDAISVSGSPLTTSGTLALTFNGTTAQYIRGNGTLETFPSLTGFVPYTGATANVNLGTFDLTADVITGATGSYTSSGGGNTLEVTHSSGSGIALNITKGGNGEGLYINKTSGSGNAATIIGTLNATTLVKSGGTSAQFLKADGSVDSNTYVTIDTFETITASKNFALGLSLGSAGGTNQASVFQNTSSLFSGSAGVNVFGFNSANNIYFGKGSDNGGVLQWSNSTVRYYTLPNATGTLALTSDLTGGTVTSVGLSSATSGVTIGSTPITTSGTITLAIATASGSQQGLLSSTDWTTFNNKQNALTNPVTGTGTTNYLPKFTGASTIGDSLLQEGTNAIGLGVTPSAWAINKAIDIAANGAFFGDGVTYDFSTGIGQNCYRTGNTSWAYKLNVGAARFELNNNNFYWFTAPSGTAGNAISFTQAMTLDSSGNLMVGTTTAIGKITFQQSTDSTVGGLAIVSVDGNGAVISRLNDGGLTFRNGGVERFRIASTGAATFSSSVRAGGDITYYNGGNLNAIITSGAADKGRMYLYNAGNPDIGFQTGGNSWFTNNLGIGTTSPSYKLDVSASINDENVIRSINTNAGNLATARVYVQNDSGSFGQFTSYSSGFGFNVFGTNAANYTALLSSGASSNGLLIGALTSDPVIFGTDNTERMRITSEGNVGIGTTNPTGRLMLYQSSAGNVFQNIVSNQGGSTQVGINLSPSMTDGEVAANPAQASIYATDSNFGANIIFANKTTGAVGNSLTERMRITSGGNVEINTGSIKTGEPDTGWGRAAIKIGASVSGTAFNVTRYLPVSVDGTVYYINLNSSTP